VGQRILEWRGYAARTGLYDGAVKALDHYLDGSGTFVEIPAGKVEKVRKQSEAAHIEKMRGKLKFAPMEAAAVWLGRNGYPTTGGKLTPPEIEIILEYQSGISSAGTTDDNLEYYGSAIQSRVRIRVRQKTVPADPTSGPVEFDLSVVEWKSWVVDNYDWEGDKSFGIFVWLGLPTQQEMRSLETWGLAKAYQRSSRSWAAAHGVVPWTDFVGSLATMKSVAPERIKSKAQTEAGRRVEYAGGALPTPEPAEDILKK